MTSYDAPIKVEINYSRALFKNNNNNISWVYSHFYCIDYVFQRASLYLYIRRCAHNLKLAVHIMVFIALTGNINCIRRQGQYLTIKRAPGGYFFFKKPPIN